jgi:hypothetical protein
MKFNREKLITDIKRIKNPAIATVLYIIIFNFLFHKICPVRLFWGIPCPGCGLTRSFLLAFRGRFAEATTMHPFWIPILLGAIVYPFERYFVRDEESSRKLQKINQIVLCVFFALLFGYYIYRLKTWYPNREPMLYESDNFRNYVSNFFRWLVNRFTNV